MAIKRNGSSLDDPINTTSGVPKFKPSGIKPSDTIHVKSTRGHKLAVAKNSKYAAQAKEYGAVLSPLRPRNLPEGDDPLAVSNYVDPTKKRKKK